MEALKRHGLSRHGYRSHLTRIITAANEIIDKNPSELTESDITSLADWQKQLNRKKEILTDVDAKIVTLIEDAEKLESEILETEEIQETISQHAAQINRVLRQYRFNNPGPSTFVQTVTLPQFPTSVLNAENSTSSSETVSIPTREDDSSHTPMNQKLRSFQPQSHPQRAM